MLKESSYIDRIYHEQLCRTSLYEYAKLVWRLIEGKPYVDNWHVHVLCEHLEAVTRRDIRKLIVNLPPRTTKTSLIMVIWPTWVWITNPQSQFLVVSNGEGMAKKCAGDSMNILISDIFQQYWGSVFALSKNQKEKLYYSNNKLGYRVSVTRKTTVIGRGGDFILADDFNSPFESEGEQQSIIDFWKGTLFGRANDPKTSCWVVFQQRTGMNDLTAHLLKNSDWTHLYLPMEYDPTRTCRTIILPSTKGQPWHDPRTKPGELLWPGRYDDDGVKAIKKELGSYIYAGQHQQSPRDEEGGLILRKDWKVWREPYRPKLTYIFQSWDTALTNKDLSAYSVCTTWGIFDYKGTPNIILLSCWRARVKVPELLRRATRLSGNYLDTGEIPKKYNSKYTPDIVVIEEKASGYGLVADLIEKGIPAHGFNPDPYGDKVTRVKRISAFIECGMVWVAGQPPDFEELRPEAELVVENCATFPNGESKDVVDTVSQALLYAREKGLLRHHENIIFLQDKLEAEELPGHKHPLEKEFEWQAKKREMTKKEMQRAFNDPYGFMMRAEDEEEEGDA